MIEHRYRAWDKHLKKMSYYVNVYSEGDEWWWAADHIDPDNGDTICSFDEKVGELMQYVDKKDMDGKRIYASDIIKIDWDDDTADVISIVTWEFNCWKPDWITGHYFKVIGNIYEQPELTP